MRKIIFFLLCCLIFTGCSSQKRVSSWNQENGKIKVLSTTAMIDDLVKSIGGEYIDRMTLISGELDPHSYELVKGDDEKIARANLVITNGLGLEHGASLRYWIEKHPFALSIGHEICKNFPELILYVDEELDPHIWMDISIWIKAIDPIAEALCKLDPGHASIFQANALRTQQEMLRVHEKILQQIQDVPSNKRFLVTSHDAFNYFTRTYLADPADQDWRQRFAAPEGLAPDGQLSTSDIQRIINHLCQYKIGIVFPESNVSKDSLRKIVSSCKDMGHQVEISSEALYGDAMGGKDSDANTYLKMIEHNASVLLHYWQ